MLCRINAHIQINEAINQTSPYSTEHPRLISLYRMKALDIQRKSIFLFRSFFIHSSTEEKSAAEISFCETLCFFSSLFSFAILFDVLFREGLETVLKSFSFESDGWTHINAIPIFGFPTFDAVLFIFVCGKTFFLPFNSMRKFQDFQLFYCFSFIYTKAEQSLNLCQATENFTTRNKCFGGKYFEIIFIEFIEQSHPIRWRQLWDF